MQNFRKSRLRSSTKTKLAAADIRLSYRGDTRRGSILLGFPSQGARAYPRPGTSQKFTADSYVYEILSALCRFMWEYSVRAVGKFSLSPTLTGLSSSLLSFTS
jgi:hypothetical protein